MSGYSGDKLKELKEQGQKWLEKFENSHFYENLSQAEQERSFLVIDSFFDFMYQELGLTSDQWQPDSIRDCCLSLLNKKPEQDRIHFTCFLEILEVFFKFMVESSIIENGKELAAVVRELREELPTGWELSGESGEDSSGEASTEPTVDISAIDKVVELEKYYKGKKPDRSEGSDSQAAYNRARDRLWGKIFQFFREIEEEYREEIADYYRQFSEITGVEIDTGLPQEIESFLLFFLIFDHRLEGEQGVLELFRRRRREKLTEKERELLEAWIDLPLKLYSIEGQEGEDYLLRDIFFGEELVAVNKKQKLTPGEIVVGRLAEVGSEYQLIGPYNTISGEYEELLVGHIEEKFAEYKQETGQDDFSCFLREWSIVLLDLFKNIHTFIEQEVRFIYEVRYSIQSRELVSRKLSSLPEVKEESEAEETPEVDFLIWAPREGSKKEVRGNFLIDDQELFFRTHLQENLEAGKELIQEVLSFVAVFREEYKADLETGEIVEYLGDRPEEISEEIIEKFIQEPIFPGGREPLELVESSEGREKLRDYIRHMELIAKFVRESGGQFFNLAEINMLKQRLGLERKDGSILEDGVEKLLVEKMKARDFAGEVICEAILLWREYRENSPPVSGRDEGWAAALEYLMSRINYWFDSQQKIADEYGVSPPTVSKKYREIAEVLELDL